MRNPLIKQAALALAGIFASVMFAGATAWANEAEQTEKKDAVALGQITVTARKKAEKVRKVPVLMDVATQEGLTNQRTVPKE